MISIQTSEQKKRRTYDAIVVGSGISGGWAAKELTEKGLRVLMLERGKPLEHITGYAETNRDPWAFEHRGRPTVAQYENHPIHRRKPYYGEHTEGYWFNDADAPYTETKRFDWIRPNIVGGRSILWGRQTYRWSDLDFEANLKEGVGADWPVRYADIKPWYDYVERFVGVSGENLGLAHFPDQQLLPPMLMNDVEKMVKTRIESHFQNRYMTIGRVANLTQPHNGRGSCQYRNLCIRGCPYGSYFSTQAATLPAAMATKKLTLRPDSIVTHLLFDEKKHRVAGLEVLDSQSNERHTYYAKIIFLCASTIGSTWILLNSRPPQYPEGIGASSGVLGHYLMDHHQRAGASAKVEGFDDKYYLGRRPNGIYVPRFRNVGNDKRNYLRGFGYQGAASRESWQRVIAEAGFGADFKEKATEPGDWTMGLWGFGEGLPYFENQVHLNFDKKDKWGLPTLNFDAEFKENERLMRLDMANDAAEMLEAAGCKNVRPYNEMTPPGHSIHEMGTARMGNDPKQSVLNKHNQVHDCPNVFVTDGSFMVSASCVNPSLTYMAFTARAADYAVKELKAQRL